MIKLELVGTEIADEWNKFVRSSVYPHFYNETDFFDYYLHKVKQVHRFVFREGKKIICVLPGGLVSKDDGRELHSPFSASFGGFSHRANRRLEDLYVCMELLINFCEKEKIRRLVIQQPPVIYAHTPDEIWEHVFWAFGFKILQCDLSYYLELRKDFLEGISASARRSVHRASRVGMTFEEMDNAALAYDFISRCRAERGLSLSVGRQEFLGLTQRLAERICCYRVALKGETMAATINYLINPWVTLAMFWAHDTSFAKYRPLDYLVANCAHHDYTMGVRYFDLGTTTINGRPIKGVTEYKEKFAPKGVLRRRYVKEVSPP